MFKNLLIASLIYCLNISLSGQSIVDPCFTSHEGLGFYTGSDDLKNVCRCSNPYLASDIIEWDGIQWNGTPPNGNITIVPPDNCHIRAIWMSRWTGGGEGFAMRLSTSFEAGKSYSYKFTYAGDGTGSFGSFSPYIYTNNTSVLAGAKLLGRLPPADDWRTETFTFTADASQNNHTWLFVYIDDDAGMILADCIPDDPITIADLIIEEDTAICAGTTMQLDLPSGNYTYEWSTGEVTQSIHVQDSGIYRANLYYYNCFKSDSVKIKLLDCEVRLTMPNFFSPNYYDELNAVFLPMENNQIQSGVMKIFNRWGNSIFTGDLFKGWDGKQDGNESSTGVYYYEIVYIDTYGKTYEKKGTVTLAR